MLSYNNQVVFWDNVCNDPKLQFPENDGFLSNWVDQLRKAKRIVDLGCGNGVNTLFLQEHGIQTISCDFSEPALNLLLMRIPDAAVLLFDMRSGLPFLSNNIDAVIADLSLHYFSFEDTTAIVREIHRSLSPGGLFICRVNALDSAMSFQGYQEIEKDYYEMDGCTKRFFTVESLGDFLSGFSIKKLYEEETWKYRSAKKTIVCEAYKKAE